MNAGQVQAIADALVSRIEDEIIARMSYVGEEFVKNARNKNTYKDQTGNLRASIGYLIQRNGEKEIENFQGKTDEGAKKGKEIANAAAARFPRGLVLICVAGMEYAAYVEAKGYDVITSSTLIAAQNIKNDLTDLIKNLK